MKLIVAALASLSVAFAITNPEGLKFLEENAEREEVVVLDSGLQYEYLVRGNGAEHPTVNSPCSCHYEGTLINGEVFDSSYQRSAPSTFAPNQVIKGWTEAMQLMVAGDKLRLYIPADLAYGAGGSPPKIGPNEALVFTIEMLEIQGDSVAALKCEAQTLDKCNEKEVAYIKKMKDFASDAAAAELARLEKMFQGGIRGASNKVWVQRRMHILKQLHSGPGADSTRGDL